MMTNRIWALAWGCFCLIIPVQSHAQDVFPFVAEVTADRVHLRAGQSPSFESLGILAKGDQLVVVDKKFSWYKVRLPKETKIYTSAEYVKPGYEQIGTVSGSRVNIRSGMGEQYTVLGQAQKGDLVKIRHKEGEWYEIEPLPQTHGCDADEFIVFKSKDVPPLEILEMPSRNIYQKKAEKVTPPQKEAVLTELSSETNTPEQPVEVIEQKQSDPGRVSIIGKLEPIGKPDESLSPDIFHKLIVDDDTVYYLKGHKGIMDGFLHYKVKIDGEIKKKSQELFKYPVITVARINLVL